MLKLLLVDQASVIDPLMASADISVNALHQKITGQLIASFNADLP